MRIEDCGVTRSWRRLRARLYARPWLWPILSTAFVLACIWLAPFGYARGGESELRVSIEGSPELVYDPKRDACTPSDIPDVNARAVRTADGSVMLTALHFINRALRGPDLDQLKIDCNVVLSSAQSPDPAAYDGRRFITSLWTNDGKNVAALVHNEYHAEHFPGRCLYTDDLPCWYNTVLAFRSANGGESFTKSRPLVLAAAPFRQDVGQGRHRGFFNPSNIFSDGRHTYAFIATTGWNAQPAGTCLFRNADPLNSAGWRAFDGTAFSIRYDDPYSGRSFAPSACAPIGPFGFPVGAVVRHRPSGLFLAIWAAPKNEQERPVDGFYVASSRNLIDWTSPRLLVAGKTMMSPACGPDGRGGDGSVIAYPSLLDAEATGRNFDNVGDEAWLYYTAIKVEGCTPGAARVLLRRKIAVGVPAFGKERRS
jgi:hypothetical protein